MKLFISYRSSNSDRVDSIVTRLRTLRDDAGNPRYTIWQDKHDIPAGKDWWEAIVEAIIDCDVMLFMISRESVQNINCRAELSYARKRNRPIIPVVLENEFTYNPITGKNDIDYWKDVPTELTDLRAQFLFYEGASFVPRLETALTHIRQQPQRWRDIPAPMPPDPRPAADGDDTNRDSSELYDQACDYALRSEFDTAERLFQRLVNANDPIFGQESYDWIVLLREYTQIVRFDARESTRFKAPIEWDTYSRQFPKVFIDFFDPNNLRARYSTVDDADEPQLGSKLLSSIFGKVTPKLGTYYTQTQRAKVIPANGITVRVKPEAQADITYILKPGTVVDVLEHNGNWLQIRYRSVVGFAAAEFFQFLSETSTAKPTKIVSIPANSIFELDPSLATTITAEQQRLLDIMLDWEHHDPPERAEAGRKLAEIGDPRSGVGLRPDGLPDIAWREVHGGKAMIGGDKEAIHCLPFHEIEIPTFYISKYPITYKQFQTFLDSIDGFANDQWWLGLADRQPTSGKQQFRYANHPCENVSWYDATAFCCWLTTKLGYEINLPTEQQWEKAARGESGYLFPWGNKYIIGYSNIDETHEEQKVGAYYLDMTTAVGLYPQSLSFYEVADLSGNVWEWTRSEGESASNKSRSSMGKRTFRGGSWFRPLFDARSASRYGFDPDYRYSDVGFRVICNHYL